MLILQILLEVRIVFTARIAMWCPLVRVLLQAELYETDFRPVPLEEYIKVGPGLIRTRPHTSAHAPRQG